MNCPENQSEFSLCPQSRRDRSDFDGFAPGSSDMSQTLPRRVSSDMSPVSTLSRVDPLLQAIHNAESNTFEYPAIPDDFPPVHLLAVPEPNPELTSGTKIFQLSDLVWVRHAEQNVQAGQTLLTARINDFIAIDIRCVKNFRNLSITSTFTGTIELTVNNEDLDLTSNIQ